MVSLQPEGLQEGLLPQLTVSASVKAPAPATLRITDGRQGKAEAPVVRSQAFQLTTEEARVAPDVVTGMVLFPLFYLYDVMILMCALCICV